MRRRLAATIGLGLVTACAVGPSYKRPVLDVPTAWRAPSASSDSLRPFYDSLMVFRDTVPLVPGVPWQFPPTDSVPAALMVLADSTATLEWFDLLLDPELRRLVETALNENRDVRVALATIDEYRAQYGVANSDFYPQVSLAGQAGRTRTVLGTLGSFTYNSIQAAAALQWELDFWGRIRRAAEAGKNDLLSQEENRRAVVLTLVSDVASAYLRLRELDLELEISERTLTANRETLRLARRRFDQGLISELDVRRFESEVASPAASVAQLQGQISQQEALLSVLVGHNPENIPRGRPLTEVLGSLAIPAYLPSALLERRPDVRQAEENLHAATARIGAATAERLPKFTITGAYGTFSRNTSDLFQSDNQTYQILGGVSVPLFTGGRLSSQVGVAKARAAQSRYQYEQTVLTALQEAEQALVGVRAARNQVAAQQTQVDALRRALRLAELRYEAGSSSYLDLLDAQRSLFSAELSLAQQQGQQALAAVTLYRALGGGWPVTTP